MRRAYCCALFSTAAIFAAPQALANTYLIDVRTPQEFTADHIDNALNIEYQNIMVGVTQHNISKDDSIYLYCRSGHRAGIAEAELKNNGFSKVVNLGGIEDARKTLGK